MSTTITERPHLYSFSLNEIRYVLKVTDPATPGCAVDFELYYHNITGGAAILFKSFTLTPAGDGTIFCHVRDYLDSLLKPQLPVISGDTIQPVGDQVKYFYIRYRQITKADTAPQWKTDETNKRIVVLGGVEQMKFQRNNFFVTYLVATKAFLTWQPSNRFVFVNETHYLTFLLTAPADFTLRVHTVFTDLTSHDTDIAYTAGNNVLFRIKAGAHDLALDAIDPAKQLYYYEISVIKTGDGGILASPHRFYLEYRPLYSYSDISFFNSLGGLDAVRVKGEVSWSIDNSGDDVEHITGSEVYNTDRPQPQFSQVNQVKKDNYKGDAGWRRTPAQQEALVELLLSKGRYEIVDGRWIGIVNLKKSLDLRLTTDKKWSFPVEWSYGYSDRVFTPKWVILGTGIADVIDPPPPPSCVSVSFPSGLAMPDGVVNVAYMYSFAMSGTAPFTLRDVVKPAWMTIAISGNNVNFSGTPDVSVTSAPVTFTIINCGADTANFIDSIDIAPAAVTTGHNPFVINNTGGPLQLKSNGVMYPSAATTDGFVAIINPATLIFIVTANTAASYKMEFLTSMGSAPIYSIVITNAEAVFLATDPNDPVTGSNNINYITISNP